MDLLPTLVQLADAEAVSGVAGPLDGESLVPLLLGERTERDTVVAEYLAEGAIAPIVMVRRGDMKFVHSPTDPDQLFDLAADPLERNNVTADPDYADILADLRAEVAARWDLAALDLDVRDSQRRRHAVAQALATGAETSWDYPPPYDASHRYIRNHQELSDLETMARYPPVKKLGPPEP
jgi:choline-sulfatase